MKLKYSIVPVAPTLGAPAAPARMLGAHSFRPGHVLGLLLRPVLVTPGGRCPLSLAPIRCPAPAPRLRGSEEAERRR